MTKGKLEDPADKAKAAQRADKAKEEMKTFDISRLTLADFKAIPKGAARSPHPFEGYPIKEPVEIGKDDKGRPVLISPTYIVALAPTVYVHQDPSGKRVSQIVDGKERFVDYESLHSRCVRDYEGGDSNIEVVFDRPLKLKDGTVKIAVVPSHSARAQIFFKIAARTNKIDVDERYLLMDFGQSSRLRRVFEMIHNPRIRNERLAAAISGESLEPLEEIPTTELE